MALEFPSGPSDGQGYIDPLTGASYIYNATYTVWKQQTPSTINKASAADVWVAAVDKIITADDIVLASAPVSVKSIGSTITFDWGSGINFTHIANDNSTLANCTNVQVGTNRRFEWTQNTIGGAKTLALSSQYVTVGNAAITVSTSNGAVDVLTMYGRSANIVEVYISSNVS